MLHVHVYMCYVANCILIIASALSETQWRALVAGRYMITMMVLLCYVNLSGTLLECRYNSICKIGLSNYEYLSKNIIAVSYIAKQYYVYEITFHAIIKYAST